MTDKEKVEILTNTLNAYRNLLEGFAGKLEHTAASFKGYAGAIKETIEYVETGKRPLETGIKKFVF